MLSGSAIVAESAWVPVNVVQSGARPVLTRVDAIGNPVLPGEEGIAFTTSGRTLAVGESVRYVVFLSYLGALFPKSMPILKRLPYRPFFSLCRGTALG